MKCIILNVFFVLSAMMTMSADNILYTQTAENMLSADNDGKNTVMSSPTYRQVLLCSPSDSVRITLLGLTLHADSGSVIDAFTLSAERLPSTDAVAPMPSGMVNVTTGRAIYRLLLHGEHFIDPAVLTMEYDPWFRYR